MEKINNLKEHLTEKHESVTENPRSILSFYRDNKSIITLKEKEFKEWLERENIASTLNGKFIATAEAIENDYLKIKRKVIIDIEDFSWAISLNTLITFKGQNYILNYFKEVNSNEQ